MPEFVSDGQPYETPIAAANQGYAAIPRTPGQTISLFAAQATQGLGRYLNEALVEPRGFGAQVGRGLVATSEMEGGVPPEQRIFPDDNPFGTQPLPDPPLPQDEINRRFGPIGLDGKQVPIADAPMGPKLGALLGEAKRQEIERQNVWNRYANAHSWPTRFATGIASFMLDPLNDATLFVPGFGEEMLLGLAGRAGLTGVAATAAARAGAGALSATAALAPVTALEYGIGREEQSDYGLRQAFTDLLFNAVAGGVLHAGLGAAFGTRDLTLSATDKYDAMKAAVAQVAGGREVDVNPVLDAAPSSRLYTAPEELPGAGPVSVTPPETIPAVPALSVSAPQAAVEPIYQGLFDALRTGSDTLNGTPNLNIARAKPFFDQGIVQSPADLKALIEAHYSPQRAGLVPPPTPPELLPNSSPAEVAARQAHLDREGTVPGMPQEEVAAAKAELEATQPRPPDTSPSGEEITPPAQRLAADTAELAAAEQRFAELSPEGRTPEENVDLAATAKGVEESNGIANGFAAAAECIAKGLA